MFFIFFFFNDTATTEIYTLSLHDALPILPEAARSSASAASGSGRSNSSSWWKRSTAERRPRSRSFTWSATTSSPTRSEEHTSELQSPDHLVCRLLLEKKKEKNELIGPHIV